VETLQSLKQTREGERLRYTEGHSGTVFPDELVGTWMNTNAATPGIAKVVLGSQDGQLRMRAFGSGDSLLLDWGEISAALFAGEINSDEAAAFNAVYDFDFMQTELQGHVRQGVLIVAKFDHFKDDSGRSNCVAKEFFYRADV
jgi:hypothetical protein